MKNKICKQSAVSGAQQFITLEQIWGTCDFRVVVHYVTGGIVEARDFGNEYHEASAYYVELCKTIEVDPSPEHTKYVNLGNALRAVGWVSVHIWQESHGEYNQETFEAPAFSPAAPVHQLQVTVYRDAQPTECRIERNPHGSYLLAREIKANESGSWTPLSGERISPCCTSGSRDYKHKHNDRFVRVTGVAGHGEWAVELTAGEAH